MDKQGLAEELFRHWVHSFEEDHNGLLVYRPSDYPFPVARGRDGFEILPDGRFVRHDIGPGDGRVNITGRWTADGQSALVVTLEDRAVEPYRMEILRVDEAVLHVRLDQTVEALRSYERLPAPISCRLIPFESAEIRPATPESAGEWTLVVSGTKPGLNLTIELVPRIYIDQPEYWGIEVVGCLRGTIILPALGPFTETLDLVGATGTRGVEVIGATTSQRLDVPPAASATWRCSAWAAWHDHQPPGPAVLHVRGSCEFPAAGYEAEFRRHEPQGINPADLLLELVVHEPEGPSATVVTALEVSYREETDFEYHSVTIVPTGPTIEVEQVH